MVSIQVGAYLRVYARWSFAAFAGIGVAPMHAIHVGRRSSKVAQVTFEIRHINDLLHFFQDVFLRTACDELALMSGDGTEGTASETATMDVDRMFDHVVGRNALATAVYLRK